MIRNFKFLGVAIMAVCLTIGTANAQFSLVPNGDFETIDGDSWRIAASGGTGINFPTTGGNGGGYGVIDATGGTWGGVLVNEGGTGPNPPETAGLSLVSLGLNPGDTVTFSWDQIDLLGNNAVAGIKIESFAAGAFLSDSTDQLFATNSTWTNHTYDYTIDPAADAIKIVLVQNQGFNGNGGGTTGFDNVGYFNVIPEPTSAAVIALGMVGVLVRRRRS